MGQTLTHGVYLPDEGERNCYDGLASNWSILDGAVGTVAEHTTALAGKAPLVHTHTKSDVTDLLNSNFIPSADNTYNIGSATYRWSSVWGASFKTKSTNIDLTDSATTGNKENWYFASYDKNENAFFLFSNQRNHSAGSNEEHFRLKNASGKWADFYLKLTDSNEFSVALSMHSDVTNNGFRGKFVPTAPLVPAANNTYDLGSSSYQWNNVYSKGYYYNGTAWGLNKSNTWTTYNTFTGDASPIRVRGSSSDVYNVQPQIAIYSQITFVDKNNIAMSYLLFQHRSDATETHRICLRQNKITSDSYYSVDLNNLGDFYPEQNNEIDLGTSTNKWKSLNGVNPGALSLPDLSDPDPIDTRTWVISTPTNNAYTPSENGWLNVVVANMSTSTQEFSIYVKSTNFFASAVHRLVDIDDNKGKVGLFIPVIAGITYYVVVKGNVSNGTISATLYPCFGSV